MAGPAAWEDAPELSAEDLERLSSGPGQPFNGQDSLVSGYPVPGIDGGSFTQGVAPSGLAGIPQAPASGGQPNIHPNSVAPVPVSAAPTVSGNDSMPIGGATPGASQILTGVPGYTSGTAVSATAPQTVGYQAVSVLTSAQLFNTTAEQFKHLEPIILQVRDYVQRCLTDQGLAADVDRARTDPAVKSTITATIDRIALQYITAEQLLHGPESPYVIASVISEIVGFGPLDPLIADHNITEIMVNGPSVCYAEIGGIVYRVPGVAFRDREHLLEMCQRILRPLNRSVDTRNPLEDGRLPDGARVNVVHPSIAADGPVLTIRRFGDSVWTLPKLVSVGGVDEHVACFLAHSIRSRLSILVSGGTGSGKTTALNAIAGMIPRHERLLTVEDSRELRLPPDAHVVALEARPAAANGEGGITIRQLVRNALRMRPSRIIVGEVRDSAAVDMLTAMNTGHEGSLTTLHANGPEEVFDRLAVMIAQSGEIPSAQVARFVSSAIDLIVHVRRYEDGSRRIASIHQVLRGKENPNPDSVSLRPLWEWVQTGVGENNSLIGEYQQLNDLTDGIKRERRVPDTLPTWIEVISLATQGTAQGAAQTNLETPVGGNP